MHTTSRGGAVPKAKGASRRIAAAVQLVLVVAAFVLTKFQQSLGRWDDPGLWYALLTSLVLVFFADLALVAVLVIRSRWRRRHG